MNYHLSNITRIIDRETPGPQLESDSQCLQERHRERELMIALEGNVDFTLGGKVFRALPGTVFFIDSWVPHKQNYMPDDANCTHYWLHLHDRRLFGRTLHLNEKGMHSYNEITEFTSELTPLVRQRWQLLERNGISPDAKKALQLSILNMIFDDLELQPHLTGIAMGQAVDLVEMARRFILMNHGRIVPRGELKNICGCTEHHLMRIFKQQTGQTIGEYTNNVRRDFVASAMAKGLSQKEIASQLGFSSASAFWLWRNRINNHKR